jgi:hypothetical protein
MKFPIFSKGTKILGIPSNMCWVIYFLCVLGFMAVILYALTVDSWVSQGANQTGRFKNYNLYYSAWEGSLFEVTQASFNLEGESYNSLSEDYCQMKDDLNTTDTYYDLANAWCDMFTSLYIAGIALTVFESFALLFFILWAISLVFVMMEKHQWLICSICNAVTVLLLHILGCVLYAKYIPITYEGDCSDLRDGDSPANLCAEEGAEIIGVMAVVLIVLVFVFIVLSIIAYIRRDSVPKRISKKVGDSDFTSRAELEMGIRREEAKGTYVVVEKGEEPPMICIPERVAPIAPPKEIWTPTSSHPISTVNNPE